MRKFEYHNPVRIISGAGEVERLGKEVAALGSSALVVSYESYDFMQELLHQVCKSLSTAGLKVDTLYKVVANPLISTAEEAIELCRNKKIDVVIGVGGGSVMDTAKIIAAGAKYKDDLWNMFYSRHDKFDNIPPTEALPIVTVPTLPATSSEMNCAAVATHDTLAEKAYVAAPCLYPALSILDPNLLVTLPAYQTACASADALSHCLEVYLNNTVNNPLQYRHMEAIMLTIIENSQQVLKDPTNVELRGIQQWTATVAWNGMTVPGTDGFFPMHTLGHSISALFNIAHGHTLALMMPAYMRYNYQHNTERYFAFAKDVMANDTNSGSLEEIILKAIDQFETYLNNLGLATKLSQLSIPKDQLEKITQESIKVYGDADELIGNVKPLNKTDLLRILELAY
ncbi:MAG: iron-containing alcohol dehydrogenase [Carboxylicivirga sp.]|jgi:alcohol dehydrogenase YqhD (iron-dependent ADH family)|nr:iron-containing alcohol dehydrogenase [Carboxylicivirga sp.]